MSRLDSVIRRLSAQRACLDAAAERINELPGPVLEIGLGNGRTYDHLRERLPSRAILVFDRVIAAHPDCVPPQELLFLGELEDTLRQARERIGATAALAHADIGSGRAAQDQAVAALLSRMLPLLMRPNGIVVSDQALSGEAFVAEPLPRDIAPGRYFLYRRRA
ncbi:MAG: class I SAM-dependent methyltransferase [Rhodospirillales bacterium]|nr:class I SAM-dependent methyltransferase [Rhodospirillales bacterium]